MMLGGDYTWDEPDDVRELGDLQELELAGVRFVVDHTPGPHRGLGDLPLAVPRRPTRSPR